MAPTFTEGRHHGEGLLSEASGSRSREAVTVASGSGIIAPGSVLGKITASGKYKLSTDTGADGGQTAVAIALYGCDATSADQKITAIVRDAEWNGNTLTYDATVNDNTKRTAKKTQLAAVGIIIRD